MTLPLFGIETEYGIAVEDRGPGDLVSEARSVVRAYSGPTGSPWHYRGEDPRNDMRGFRVDRLSQDPQDAVYDVDRKPLPIEEERSDRVLANGARLYNDHGHPEYSTPECASLLDLVTHDKAGERIVLACAKARMAQEGVGRIDIFKNNTDFHGSSYGTHENYLIDRRTPFPELLSSLLPFFVTRIVYAGAGKIGIEPNGDRGIYQLSQRADFFTEEASVDTLYRRPLINTRDEPHADPAVWRRMHVICGDANMSEFATALRVGAAYLVTSLLETGWRSEIRLRDPVQAIKDISRDQTCRWIVPLADNKGTIPAIDIQRHYLAAAQERFAGRGTDTDWTLRAWSETLDALEADPSTLKDRLDWVAKRSVLTDYVEATGVGWDDESLASFDLAYSNVDPDEGLYYALEQAGEMVRLTTDADIEQAIASPPENTRAAIRGSIVGRFPECVGVVGWNKMLLRDGDESWLLDMSEYLFPDDVRAVMARLEASPDLGTFIRLHQEPQK